MKRKFILLLLAIVSVCCLAFGLTACGDGNNVNNGSGSGTGEYALAYMDNEDGGLTVFLAPEYFGASSPEEIIIPSSHNGKSVTRLSHLSGATNLKRVVIPDSVTKIEDRAFEDCGKLESVKLPSGLTRIPDGTFSNCNLKDIEIPESVTEIGSMAFYGNPLTGDFTLPEGVTEIGGDAFAYTGLTEFKTPAGVSRLYPNLFAHSALRHIEIGPNVTMIDNRVFSYTQLEELIIPDTVTEFRGGDLLAGCNSIKSITIPNVKTNGTDYFTVAMLFDISGRTDAPSSLQTVTISGGTIWANHDGGGVDTNVFVGCNSITELVLGENVTEIQEGALAGLSSLTKLTLPASGMVTEQWNYDSSEARIVPLGYFFHNDDLWGGAGKTISQNYYYVSDINVNNISPLPTSFKIPSSLKSVTILNEVIRGGLDGLGLTEVYLGKNVQTLAPDWLGEYNQVNTLVADEKSEYILSIDNVLYAKDGMQLLCAAGSIKGEIEIPEGVTEIPESAFSARVQLTAVKLPQSLQKIGDNAFAHCTSLAEIDIPNGVNSIGAGAFSDCGSLESINFEGTIEQWNAISKIDDWDHKTDNYTVHCTNGDIEKSAP